MGISDKLQQIKKEKAMQNKEQGEQFLAQNKQKNTVITTDSGLQYEIIKEGSGAHPTESSRVTCHYKGALIDGTVFDNSYERGRPATFPLNQVIAGWTEGLQLMQVGAVYKFYIPSELGYGDRQVGSNIPPNSVLIFDVELIGM